MKKTYVYPVISLINIDDEQELLVGTQVHMTDPVDGPPIKKPGEGGDWGDAKGDNGLFDGSDFDEDEEVIGSSRKPWWRR